MWKEKRLFHHRRFNFRFRPWSAAHRISRTHSHIPNGTLNSNAVDIFHLSFFRIAAILRISPCIQKEPNVSIGGWGRNEWVKSASNASQKSFPLSNIGREWISSSSAHTHTHTYSHVRENDRVTSAKNRATIFGLLNQLFLHSAGPRANK